MDYPRFCGCKGCRTCLQCESKLGIQEKGFYQQFKDKTSYVFCPHCDRLYPGWDCDAIVAQHPLHAGVPGQPFAGVHIRTEWIDADEEAALMRGIDEMPWATSQSGRRKQNFGPKTNFKKNKLQCGSFAGFPRFSQFVQRRFAEHPLLATFRTIEQCSLEYDPAKGASIDPHIDDCWVWGERVVTVNLLSDSVLTLTLYEGDRTRYNLPLVDAYRRHLLAACEPEAELTQRWSAAVVRLPMPRRSLMVLYGGPRYQWEHCVLREDVRARRVCIAYREFTTPYLPAYAQTAEETAAAEEQGGSSKAAEELRKGEAVLARAAEFFDHRQASTMTSVQT